MWYYLLFVLFVSPRPVRVRAGRHGLYVPGQVLPGGRGGGAGARGDAAPAVPAGEAGHPQYGHLLSARGQCASGQLRRPGQGTSR